MLMLEMHNYEFCKYVSCVIYLCILELFTVMYLYVLYDQGSLCICLGRNKNPIWGSRINSYALKQRGI